MNSCKVFLLGMMCRLVDKIANTSSHENKQFQTLFLKRERMEVEVTASPKEKLLSSLRNKISIEEAQGQFIPSQQTINFSKMKGK